MIVIVNVNRAEFYAYSGDEFQLTVGEEKDKTILIRQVIQQTLKINFTAAYCFIDVEGNCIGSNICGIFGNEDNLPEEIKNALLLENLTPKQLENFSRTSPVQITSNY